MYQCCEFVDVSQKIEDKIASMEIKRRRKFTRKQKIQLAEAFLSGMFFGIQYNRGEE